MQLSLQRKLPHVLSLTDFIGWRFGFASKTYVVLLILFNMSIGEHTFCIKSLKKPSQKGVAL